MTKAELVEEVARAAELNKRDAEVIVETVFDSIISALHKGEKVELRGFGSFRTRERGPRRDRNPKTGEPVDVPAKRVPYFKPGKELKEYFTDSPDGQEGSSESAVGASASDASAAESAGISVSSTGASDLSGGDAGEAGNEPATDAAAGGGQEPATETGEGRSGEGPTA